MRTLRLLAIVWCTAAMQTAAVLGDVLGKAELREQAKEAAERKARAEGRRAVREPEWYKEARQVREDGA